MFPDQSNVLYPSDLQQYVCFPEVTIGVLECPQSACCCRSEVKGQRALQDSSCSFTNWLVKMPVVSLTLHRLISFCVLVYDFVIAWCLGAYLFIVSRFDSVESTAVCIWLMQMMIGRLGQRLRLLSRHRNLSLQQGCRRDF